MRTSLSSAKGLRASKDVAKVHSATANISSGAPRDPGDSSGGSCSPESHDLHSAPESSSRNKHHGLAAQPASLLTLTNLKQAARRLHIVYDQRENDEGTNRADARLSSASYASVDSQDCRGGRRALRRNFASALANKRASQTNPRGITGVLLEKMQRIESTLATAANGVRSGEDRQHQQQDILDQFAEQLRRIEHAVCRKDAHSSSKSKAPDGSIK
uniref:Uncharacterized protein n=2 Tax=Chrysotila carterae TaxID=13221 RepID=A0A7S4B296_CHRCT